MRDNTFTPGPWMLGADGEKIITNYRDENGKMTDDNWLKGGCAKSVCTVKYASWMGSGAKHNARLIAAAPDMYDALWEVCELSDRNLTEAGRTPECQRVYDIVRAALAKAEGN